MSKVIKKRILKFNFQDSLMSGEGPNVSLVTKAANLTEVLTMKAKEEAVVVTLSMKDYLKTFFNLWEEDAALLAGILGYDSTKYNEYEDGDGNYMSDEDYVKSKIESVYILKGFDEIPDKLPKGMFDVVKSLQDSVNLEDLQKSFSNANKSGDSPSDTLTKPVTGESKLELTKEEIETLKSQASQLADLQKSMSAKDEVIADLLKAKEATEKAKLLDVVKGYSFIASEDAEKVSDVLFGSADADVLLSALEGAKVALEAALTVEEGATVEEGELDINKSADDKLGSTVADIIKSRKKTS